MQDFENKDAQDEVEITDLDMHRSQPSVVVVSAAEEVTWIKAPDEIVFIQRASDGTLTWQHCKPQQRSVPGQESRSVLLICQ